MLVNAIDRESMHVCRQGIYVSLCSSRFCHKSKTAQKKKKSPGNKSQMILDASGWVTILLRIEFVSLCLAVGVVLTCLLSPEFKFCGL